MSSDDLSFYIEGTNGKGVVLIHGLAGDHAQRARALLLGEPHGGRRSDAERERSRQELQRRLELRLAEHRHHRVEHELPIAQVRLGGVAHALFGVDDRGDVLQHRDDERLPLDEDRSRGIRVDS